MKLVLVMTLAVVGACGDDGSGAVDADTTIDIDNGSCGDQVRFTGEYVDWDQDMGFCGIAAASFVVQGGGAMDDTAPNGRFDMCVPDDPVTLVGVTPPAAASSCAVPPSTYALPGVAVAHRQVIRSGGSFSARNFTDARQATYFQSIGLAFDATKAQVLVHVDGTPRAVSLDAPHGAPQAIATTTWAAGDTGKLVFFPNVDVGGGATTVTVAGGAIGTGSIPLAAGTFTYVAVLVR